MSNMAYATQQVTEFGTSKALSFVGGLYAQAHAVPYSVGDA